MIYPIVGLMSGTSMDGLDVALCEFTDEGGKWAFNLKHGVTVEFPSSIRTLLEHAPLCGGVDLVKADIAFGSWCGKMVRKICSDQAFHPLLAASHGHTVFHDPEAGITCQIGNGNSIAVQCGFPVINDFRTADILLGGQGAPLVPVGDHFLFADYSCCLNLGGIANISFIRDDQRIAFDIVPVNMVLNALAGRLGFPFDPRGSIARGGELLPDLLRKLNENPFYLKPHPKSLSREWAEAEVFPLMDEELKTADLLCTYTAHAAAQIAAVISGSHGEKVLFTGGGTYNLFLVERISAMVSSEVIIPESRIIEYKEALVFAFLGLLRWLKKPNVFATVTGATKDHCTGSLSGLL